MSVLDQKITDFDVWHLALPVVSARDHGIGQVANSCEVIVLRLRSEDGTEGYGEAATWSVFTGSPEASFAALTRYIRPFVEGRKISDRAQIMADARAAIAHCTEAKAALDCAILDIEGRLLSRPIHTLLGSDDPKPIPLSVSLADPDWGADRALLERLRADGVRLVKLKSGTHGLDHDVKRLEALAADFPEFSVRVDYNQALTAADAFAQVPVVARFSPDFIEQPVAAHDFDTMAALRHRIECPLLADESVFGPEDMTRAIRDGICDGVSVKVMKAGGLARAQNVAKLAHAAELLAYGGDMFESGLGHLAGVHMLAATPEITLGCEFYQAHYYLRDDVLERPFQIKGGAVVVPQEHGLGGRPDPQKLERYSVEKAVKK